MKNENKKDINNNTGENDLKSSFISKFSTSTNLKNIKKIDLIKLYSGYILCAVYLIGVSFCFPFKLKIHDFTYKNKFLTSFFINNIYLFFTIITIFKSDNKEIKVKKSFNNEEFHLTTIIIAILVYFESVFMLNSFDFSSNMSSILMLYGATNYFLSILLRYFFVCRKINNASILFCVLMIIMIILFHLLYYSNSTKFLETSQFVQIILPIVTGVIKSIYNVFLEYYYKEYREGFNMVKLFSLIGIYNFILGPFFIMIKLIVTKDFNIFPNKDQIIYMTVFAVLPYLIFYSLSFLIVCYCTSEIYSLVIFTAASSLLTVEYFFTKDENFHWIIILILVISIFMIIYELITYYNNFIKEYNTQDENLDSCNNNEYKGLNTNTTNTIECNNYLSNDINAKEYDDN